MVDEKERVVAMHLSRIRNGPREEGEPASPADLVSRTAVPPREALPMSRIPAPADREDPGGGTESFDPARTDYKAFGWANNRTVPTLVVILKDGTECGINYADLATAWPGGSSFMPSAPGYAGNVIRLLVAGDAGRFSLVIEGLRLRRVWELIMAHKTPWIHELPAGIAVGGDAEPVIRSVRLEEPRGDAGKR
jgi:hypothetical protein